MKNKGQHGDVPLGLGMALAQNMDAMNSFAALSDAQKQAVIAKAGEVGSKQEMRAFVEEIGSGRVF